MGSGQPAPRRGNCTIHMVSTGWVDMSLFLRLGISHIKPGKGGPPELRDKFHGLNSALMLADLTTDGQETWVLILPLLHPAVQS